MSFPTSPLPACLLPQCRVCRSLSADILSLPVRLDGPLLSFRAMGLRRTRKVRVQVGEAGKDPPPEPRLVHKSRQRSQSDTQRDLALLLKLSHLQFSSAQRQQPLPRQHEQQESLLRHNEQQRQQEVHCTQLPDVKSQLRWPWLLHGSSWFRCWCWFWRWRWRWRWCQLWNDQQLL